MMPPDKSSPSPTNHRHGSLRHGMGSLGLVDVSRIVGEDALERLHNFHPNSHGSVEVYRTMVFLGRHRRQQLILATRADNISLVTF